MHSQGVCYGGKISGYSSRWEVFNFVAPPQCYTVKLTRIAKPASIAEELVASHEISLAEYEGKAIMVMEFCLSIRSATSSI
jgi:hypothetical protein